MSVNKIIIPAAGLGTRFLPYTKAIPKEMLPILNKPLIQYSIEEGLAAEVNNFIIVTDKDKNAIADHLDAHHPRSIEIEERNAHTLLASTERLARMGTYTYIRQREALGLGHAITLTQHCISPKEYFGVMLPDDLIDAKESAFKQLLRISIQEKSSIIAVKEVPQQMVHQYDIIAIKKTITPSLFQVSHILEKPHIKDAPTNLAVVGRYILSPKLFNVFNHESISSVSGEISLNKAISCAIHNGERIFAYKIQGQHYTIDNPFNWLKANLDYAMKYPEYAQRLRKTMDENSIQETSHLLFNAAKTYETSL